MVVTEDTDALAWAFFHFVCVHEEDTQSETDP